MPLVRCRDIQVSFGGPAVLENISLSIESGERLCLLGRNGTGKSTLLKLIAREIKPDSGDIEYQQNLKLAVLEQQPRIDLTGTNFDIVAEGLGDHARLLQNYHHALHNFSENSSEQNATELERAQNQVDIHNAWQLNQQVEAVLSRMQLDGDLEYSALSGGMKRRVLLARALVVKPDVLLLDEPTNHLDLDTIAWLEEQLLGFKGSLLFITHDRSFMQNLATRIIDLDRGVLNSYPGDYQSYLRRREEMLHAEEVANAQFDKKLAQEEVWIRQGIKARRTRNEGRVRALLKMRDERKARREKQGNVSMKVSAAEKSGKLVVEAEGISFDYEGDSIIRDFSTTILRSDKIGVLGPNGSGKTTLLQILLGDLLPSSGKITLGTKLQVAYFDQLRAQLDENLSVVDNLSQGREFIEINGKRKHVIGYLQDFLFAPDRARSPVSMLSGGERNRLLLAKLFSKPSNILVLDEPTNDLDIETLELLEELVMEYEGTIVLVSHDRAFINNVVTSTLVFEGDGQVNEYVGGYDDWKRYVTEQYQNNKEQQASGYDKDKKQHKPQIVNKPGKLSYKDQRELDTLPAEIEVLEEALENLQALMAGDGFYRQNKEAILKVQGQLEETQKKLASCYTRWEELENRE